MLCDLKVKKRWGVGRTWAAADTVSKESSVGSWRWFTLFVLGMDNICLHYKCCASWLPYSTQC